MNMMTRFAVGAALGLLIMSGPSGCGGRSSRSVQPQLVVSAAISLSDALERVADAYEATEGVSVNLNTAGSDTLATQLVGGARADLFLSADARQMRRVEAEGLLRPDSRVDLLANRLAVVSRSDAALHLADARDLRQPSIRRIAIGDPDSVPAGVYARDYLQAAGVWEAVRARIVPTRNVRAALAAVEAGHADVGVVYHTDLAVTDRVVTAFVVPLDEGPEIRYPAAVLADATYPVVAERFLAFLRGPVARRLFEDAGFIALPATTS